MHIVRNSIFGLDGRFTTTADGLLGLTRQVSEFSVDIGQGGVVGLDGLTSDTVFESELEHNIVTEL